MIAGELKKLIEQVLSELSLSAEGFTVERPGDGKNGDYASNVALVAFRQVAAKANTKSNAIKVARGGLEIFDTPQQLADKIIEKINEHGHLAIERLEVAGPGFINITLAPSALVALVREYPTPKRAGQTIVVETNNPNPFKEIGRASCRERVYVLV